MMDADSSKGTGRSVHIEIIIRGGWPAYFFSFPIAIGILSTFGQAKVLEKKERFPEDFMFRLTEEEFKNLIFQFGTSSWGGTRKLPYAFTEQGVAMLSGVLKSDRAISVNIQIMRIFTRIRQILTDNIELRLAIEEIKSETRNNSKSIEVVFQYLDELLVKREEEIKPRNPIGFNVGN